MVHPMELFEYELYHQGKSRHTVRSYLSRVKTFLQWLEGQKGKTDPSIISEDDVREYQSFCIHVKKYAPAGNRQRLSAIRAYGDFLVARGLLTTNPADKIKPLGSDTEEYHQYPVVSVWGG